jgi:NO-binding membrane sensor protein with MHYT domain
MRMSLSSCLNSGCAAQRQGSVVDFTYNQGLVALSIAVAILGSFTGLVMTTGIANVHRAEAKLRIILGGVGIGGGIWSMHFISMLAVILPIKLSYDVAETAISAVIAIAFTATALAIVSSRRFGAATLPLSALFLGSGIGGMHYLGMHAIRGGCVLFYSWIGVTISVAIAIQASGVALWFAFRHRGVLDTFLGSIVLGLAIASMHYSGMEATRFLPASSPTEALRLVLSESYLALAIAVTLYVVCGTCILVFAVLVFRPRRPQQPYSHTLLSQPDDEVVEFHEDDIASYPSERQQEWSEPTPELAFIERRLVGVGPHERADDNDEESWREHRKLAH